MIGRCNICKDFQSPGRKNINITKKFFTTFHCNGSFLRKSWIFFKDSFIGNCLMLNLIWAMDVKLWMEKLTSVTVGTETSGMKLCARLSFKVLRYVLLFYEFMFSMCERTRILEKAFSSEFPIAAHFSLEFHLVLPDEMISFLFCVEVFFRLFDCSHFLEFIRSG